LALANTSPLGIQFGMAGAGMVTGGLLIAASGALRHWRGVNATISSLLLTYIALEVFKYLVEGPMRDPASLNKPSTYPIPEEAMLGRMGTGALEVHWGLAFGVVACLLAWVLMDHTTFGFAARMAGGNVKAAQAAGLPVGLLIITTCFLGGAAAGLAGMVEIAAAQRQANASLIAGYGFTGILVSFIARHHPLAIIPAAVLFGGLSASSGVLQRRLLLNDASVQVLMGTMFVVILLFDTVYGRFRVFQPREVREAAVA
jgi:simple sugar transport system permease protein